MGYLGSKWNYTRHDFFSSPDKTPQMFNWACAEQQSCIDFPPPDISQWLILYPESSVYTYAGVAWESDADILWVLSYCLLWLGSEIVWYECVPQHLSDTWYHMIPTHHWQLNKTFPLIHYQLCSCCIESALLSHKMLPGAIIKCFIVCRANNLSKLL